MGMILWLILRRIQGNINYKKPCAQRLEIETAKQCKQKGKDNFSIRVQMAMTYTGLT